MNNNILISVLMPCYNASAYLKEAVDSILNQTYSNFELLLIDDGSSDNTREMIQNYALADNRVVAVFNEHNLGLIRTLNKGIAMAKGVYIARMDADDISALNRVELLVNAAIANPDARVISAGYYYISTRGRILRRIYPKALTSQALKFVSFFCTPVNHPCSLIHAGLLRDNLFDELYIHSEDYEIFSRFLLAGYQIINLPEPLYYLRVNPQSVSFKFETIQISTHTKISARNIEMYFNRNYDFFLHKIMINRISFNVTLSMLRLAFRSLDELRDEYIRRESLTAGDKLQIQEFLTEQKIDIYLQSLKYARLLNRIMIISKMVSHAGIFFNRRAIQYLRSKIRMER